MVVRACGVMLLLSGRRTGGVVRLCAAAAMLPLPGLQRLLRLVEDQGARTPAPRGGEVSSWGAVKVCPARRGGEVCSWGAVGRGAAM